LINRSMPPGTIIPELVYPDLQAAVAWLCGTLDFVERLRIGDHRWTFSQSIADVDPQEWSGVLLDRAGDTD
jgi:hypothetical protein